MKQRKGSARNTDQEVLYRQATELVKLRGMLTWAAHVLHIAGECLQAHGAPETARLCRIVAGNCTPADGPAVRATMPEADEEIVF